MYLSIEILSPSKIIETSSVCSIFTICINGSIKFITLTRACKYVPNALFVSNELFLHDQLKVSRRHLTLYKSISVSATRHRRYFKQGKCLKAGGLPGGGGGPIKWASHHPSIRSSGRGEKQWREQNICRHLFPSPTEIFLHRGESTLLTLSLLESYKLFGNLSSRGIDFYTIRSSFRLE